MLISHLRAATGAVLVETREESRLLASIVAELSGATVATISAPTGALIGIDGRKLIDSMPGGTLPAAYAWASQAGGRVVVVHDYHRLINSPGHWRSLLSALPGVRQPAAASASDTASLLVFVAPSWRIDPDNPLFGILPIIPFASPTRDELRTVAERLSPLPAGPDGETIVDALCGLSADVAEQSAAETLVARGGWDVDHLRAARRRELKAGGLELWAPTAELGGLGGFQAAVENELIPWVRDEQLSIRRLLCAGVPGVGKSYGARWIAHKLGCECARLSIPALKGSLVGQSEGNLRRALRTVDSMSADAPIVVVIDEIDKLASDGLDGGTSSGMFSELLTWLQESPSQAICLATANHLDKIDAALESRFALRFFFDLPTLSERRAICSIHYSRLGCRELPLAVKRTAEQTDGYSSRELAESICPSVARLSNRTPSAEVIDSVIRHSVPASRTQTAQLDSMRRAAVTLRRANDGDDMADPHPSRRLS